MKKNYILPKIELVSVTATDVMSISIGIGDNENDVLIDVSEW